MKSQKAKLQIREDYYRAGTPEVLTKRSLSTVLSLEHLQHHGQLQIPVLLESTKVGKND